MLLREFIEQKLYAHGAGYFRMASSHIVERPSSWSFGQLADERAYRLAVASMYAAPGDDDTQDVWTTPSALLRPFVGQSVARWATKAGLPGSRVLEIGAGSGVLARDFLRFSPDTRSYWLMDVSETAIARQKARLADEPRARSFQCAHVSELLPAQSGEDNVDLIVLHEVLDNTTHDRIFMETGSSNGYRLTVVEEDAAGLHQRQVWTQAGRPDPLVNQLLEVIDVPRERVCFVPTGAFALLAAVAARWPRAALLLADFANFGEHVKVAGVNAPLVQSAVHSYDSYLNLPATPAVDILFPTDFGWLSAIVSHLFPGRSVQHRAQSEFFRRHLPPASLAEAQCVNDGFNPLLDDYSNFMVLTAPPP